MIFLCGKTENNLGQHCTKIVCVLRSQIFRQAEAAPRFAQKRRRNTRVFQGVFVQNGEKDAS